MCVCVNCNIYLIITTLTISSNSKYPISRLFLPHSEVCLIKDIYEQALIISNQDNMSIVG